ncbi:MAG TPA: hypothetical protein DIT64_17080 [Verrucomicrobiales bacterium]|nr:hypothetical protein [Verrucomicrobiales bacterium]HRJ08767.1 metallophosphoesterase [Prosthecobacter sp.]HRK15290.1 metallophosphoesterase [Prosthecobacter sp.]
MKKPKPRVCAEIAPGLVLDPRRALVHRAQGWMAVADVHYGYERNRRRQGALLPDWGMAACAETLRALLDEHQPRRLILAGDIMDGAGSAEETADFLEQLRPLAELVCLYGNHDRAGLRKRLNLARAHREDGFIFHHGHESVEAEAGLIHITGHEHPAVRLGDGAGLRLKLPALVRERLPDGGERWILPAFSPWAAGGEYHSSCGRIATWVCAPGRVWRL